MTIDDGCDLDELAAWALGAGAGHGGDPAGDRIRAHLATCRDCRARAATFRQAVGWLGCSVPAVAPPPELRGQVLTAARDQRTPCDSPLAADLGRWAVQIADLDAELAALTADQWQAPVAKHATIQGVVAHLAGNDRLISIGPPSARPTAPAEATAPAGNATPAEATALDENATLAEATVHGVTTAPAGTSPATATTPAVPATRHAWRTGAETLLFGVGGAGAPVADRPVRLAGRWGAVRPLSDALVQRGFETWIHADDVRAAVGRPLRPAPPGQVRAIVALSVRLLPGALLATGRHRAAGSARLVLTGDGGGEWIVPLHPGIPPDGPVAATITGDAAGYCRLLAGRRPVTRYPHQVDGSAPVAAGLLATAATLGCD